MGKKNDSEMMRALDDLEDARADLEKYRRMLFFTFFSLFVCGIITGLGAWFGNYAIGVVFCVLGILGIVLSIIFGGLVILSAHDGNFHPATALRKAERAYRDLIAEEGVL